MSSASAEAVGKLLRAEDGFLIVGHIDPDPDSIGSTLALRRFLTALGKKCVTVAPTPLPPLLDFLPDIEHLVSPDQAARDSWNHIVVLDAGLERTGAVAEMSERARCIVNIDHHATNPGTGTHNWIDSGYAATSQMIAALSGPLGVHPDGSAATLLYTGLVGDTGWFRFTNTSPAVLKLAAELLAMGVDIESISRNLHERHNPEYVLLLGHVLQSLGTAHNGKVVFARVTRAMRRQVGASDTEGDGFVQYLRLIRDVDVAVLFDELTNGFIRVQLRSSPGVDVSVIAKGLGGGGHARASGVRIKGSIDDVQEEVLKHIIATLEGTEAKGSE